MPTLFEKILRLNVDGVECANGGTLKVRGTVDLTAFIDGKLHAMAFNNMDIAMPIVSMIQTINQGNNLPVTEHGGNIGNKKTGRVQGMW